MDSSGQEKRTTTSKLVEGHASSYGDKRASRRILGGPKTIEVEKEEMASAVKKMKYMYIKRILSVLKITSLLQPNFTKYSGILTPVLLKRFMAKRCSDERELLKRTKILK